MWAVVVVAVAPVLGHAANLGKAGEHIAVQHFGAVGTVEAFDVGVLGRLAGLDVDQIDAVAVGPALQCRADELGTVVQP